MDRLIVIIALAGIGVSPSQVRAEKLEHLVGAEGLLILPRFEAPEKTTFTLTTWGARGFYGYGITQDLYAVARASFWMHSGQAARYTYKDSTRGDYTGTLAFHGEGYRTEVGLKWQILSGYDLTPYLEAYGGFQWTTYREPDLQDESGASYHLEIESFGEGAATGAVGLSVDYRLANTVFVGIGVFWTQLLDETYRYDLQGSLMASYYWF